MRDRAAERGRCRPLGIDVDELLVLGDLGEGVDPRLIDDQPAGGETRVRPWRRVRPLGTRLTSAQSLIRGLRTSPAAP